MTPVFSLQSRDPGDVARAETLGFDAFLAADHPGTSPSPFPVLAAAAAAGGRVRLGTCVANAGLRDPVELAVDVATLDRLSGGRALLGLGAGHTPAEWAVRGLAYPSPADRVARLAEVVEVVPRLLAGEVVRFAGRHLRLDGAVVEEPRPVQDRVPLAIGGNGRRVLGLAGRHADIVGLTGTGRTLPDGHRHEVRWGPDDLDGTVAVVRRAAAGVGRPDPAVEALVQHAELTHDREKVAAGLAARIDGLTVADALVTPFLLVGTAAEIAGQLVAHRDRWGIARYVVRPPALAVVEAVLGQSPPS